MNTDRHRARHHGLSCKTWTGNSNPATAPELLLVAVENCSWPNLQAHIMTLVRLGRLSRIVVDEVHLLVVQALYGNAGFLWDLTYLHCSQDSDMSTHSRQTAF